MKRILYIARNELHNLYYSPVAWILMILFLVLTATGYLFSMNILVGDFERGGWNLMYTQNLTDSIMSTPGLSYLYKVIANLYIFFPLITMGLISREISSGTIKLLYSSPIKVREMVLGKFLAMAAFSVVLVVLLLTTMLCLSFSLVRPDYVHMLSTALSIFLILCMYAAIGLFISSLTSYSIVAAIATLAVLAIFSQAGRMWQDVEAVRNITDYLNLSEKSANLLKGLYNSRDLGYFVILTVTFLLFTMIRVKSGAQSMSRLRKFTRYATVVVAAFVVGWITSTPQLTVYCDVTRDKVHTITSPTRAMLARLNGGPLEVTAYWNLLNQSEFPHLTPQDRNAMKNFLWEPYIRFKPDIHFKVLYYYNTEPGSYIYKSHPGMTLKQIAEKVADTYGVDMDEVLTPAEARKQVNIDDEENFCFFKLRYKGRTSILRVFGDMEFWPSENEIAAALNRLIATPQKFAFLDDEIERDPYSERIRDYKFITRQRWYRYSLSNQGFDFDTLSLRNRPVPRDLAGLVIADPRTPFSPASLTRIRDYIRDGGNLYIATEPDRADVIQPVLEELGLSLRRGLLIQPSAKYSSDCVLAYLSDTAQQMSPMTHKFLTDYRSWFGDSVYRVAMTGASAIESRPGGGWTVQPLLCTDALNCWNRVAPISADSLNLKVKGLPGDEHGIFTIAMLMHRPVAGKEQRIVVFGDADFLTYAMFRNWEPASGYNAELGSWCFSYLSHWQFPINTLRPNTDKAFRVTVADLPLQETLLYYILPALIAIAGAVVILKRRRK
jgi:ABC-2 type transport system permease protein